MLENMVNLKALDLCLVLDDEIPATQPSNSLNIPLGIHLRTPQMFLLDEYHPRGRSPSSSSWCDGSS